MVRRILCYVVLFTIITVICGILEERHPGEWDDMMRTILGW